MSAERLREAARLMRERAEAATPGPWRFMRGPGVLNTVTRTQYAATIVVATDELSQEDAGHIASWHPVVALAVADWLDDAADRIDDDVERHFGGPHKPRFDSAEAWVQRNYRAQIAVADAYLGGAA